MPTAFVLINSETGSEDEVIRALKKIDAVKEAYKVYGVHDIVVKVESDTMEELERAITWRIRRVDKIQTTQTMIVSK